MRSARRWFDHLSYELPEGVRHENMLLHSNLGACASSGRGESYSDSELFELGKHIDELPYGTVFDGASNGIARDSRKVPCQIVPFPRFGILCRIPPCYFDADSAERIQDHYSFSGVQDKFTATLERAGEDFILRMPDRRRELGNVIVKPWSYEYGFQPENEYFSMRVMEECGFDTARTALFSAPTDTGIRRMHLCVERFDFDYGSEPRPVKRSVKQFAELMDLPAVSGGKYAPTTEELFGFIEKALPPDAQSEFAMRYLFGYILGNGDMHAKNFSLIYDPQTERWKLSPVYDILNTRLYGLPNRLCLSLGEGDERHDPDLFLLVDFLSDFLGTHGFEVLYERLRRLPETAQPVGSEVETAVRRELPEENTKILAARSEFLCRLVESVQLESIRFPEHIERYYLDAPSSPEPTL